MPKGKRQKVEKAANAPNSASKELDSGVMTNTQTPIPILAMQHRPLMVNPVYLASLLNSVLLSFALLDTGSK